MAVNPSLSHPVILAGGTPSVTPASGQAIVYFRDALNTLGVKKSDGSLIYLVGDTRKINPGFGVYGGGDLSADRELGIDFAADGADDSFRTIRASDTRLPKFVRRAVRVATTVPINSMSGSGMVIDGVTTAAGDRVLVKNQLTASENGIYTVVGNGAWTRAADANTATLMTGVEVLVEQGNVHHGQLWRTNFAAFSDTLGTTAMTWGRIASLVSSLDPTVVRVAATSALTLGTTNTAISGCSVTMAVDTLSEFEVTAFADISVSTASAAVALIGLQVNGTLQAGQATLSLSSSVGRMTVGQTWKVSGLPAGNATFALVGSKSNTNGVMQTQVTHTTLAVSRL